eukprot:gene11982-505_t
MPTYLQKARRITDDAGMVWNLVLLIPRVAVLGKIDK